MPGGSLASSAGIIGVYAGAVSSVGPGAASPLSRAASERSAPRPGVEVTHCGEEAAGAHALASASTPLSVVGLDVRNPPSCRLRKEGVVDVREDRYFGFGPQPFGLEAFAQGLRHAWIVQV
ncbi:MAG: hypothetical protein CM15mP79_0180 [Methanobacteriota archaeon]|nr:MAG: hypothetical protein CM15mP79_0180 [Euryarchaeota archaeon]